MRVLDRLESLPGGEAGITYLTSHSFKPATVENYGTALIRWLTWCQERSLDPLGISSYEFDRYRTHLEATNGSLATVRNRQTVISRFYAYLTKRGAFDRTPVPDGWQIKRSEAITQRPPLPDHVVSAMVETADRVGTQHSAIVRLIVEGLMKTGEIVDLKVEDVEFVGQRALIRSDGQRSGAVASSRDVGEEAATALRAEIGNRTAGPLFLVRTRAGIDQQAIQRRLDGVRAAAGIDIRVSPEVLRRGAVARSLGDAMSGGGYGLGLGEQFRPNRVRRRLAASQSDIPARTGTLGLIDEMLELATELLDDERRSPIPAIVLTGTAIELFLKRLALAKGSTNTTNKMESWNTSLRSLGVTDSLDAKNIVVWGGLRNSASHDLETWKLTHTAARTMIELFGEFLDIHRDAIA